MFQLKWWISSGWNKLDNLELPIKVLLLLNKLSFQPWSHYTIQVASCSKNKVIEQPGVRTSYIIHAFFIHFTPTHALTQLQTLIADSQNGNCMQCLRKAFRTNMSRSYDVKTTTNHRWRAKYEVLWSFLIDLCSHTKCHVFVCITKHMLHESTYIFINPSLWPDHERLVWSRGNPWNVVDAHAAPTFSSLQRK